MNSFETLKKIVYQKDYEKFLTTVTGKEEEIEKIDLLPITNYKNSSFGSNKEELASLYQYVKYYLEQNGMYKGKLQEGFAIAISKAALSYDNSSSTLDNYFRRGDTVSCGSICNPFEELARLLLNATVETPLYIPDEAKNIFQNSASKLRLTTKVQIISVAEAFNGDKMLHKSREHNDIIASIESELEESNVQSSNPISATLSENREVLARQVGKIDGLFSDRIYCEQMIKAIYTSDQYEEALTKFYNMSRRARRNIGVYEQTKRLEYKS